mgnify:FL=1
MKSTRFLPVLMVMLLSQPVIAGDTSDNNEEILKLKNTTQNLLDNLVEIGALSEWRAQQILKQSEEQAAAQLAAEKEKQKADQESLEKDQAEAPAGVVRVPYVPDYVRDEIKGEISTDLQSKVVEDVMAQAKNEAWGVPNALPDWTRRFKFSGDLRLRLQGDIYAPNNAPFGTAFVDYNDVNDNGGFSGSFLNTDEDRYRARYRMRLGVKAKVTNGVTAGIRIATGQEGNPVSTNQTMDGDFGSKQLILDRAYVKYDGYDEDSYPWITAWGGRMPNPWFKTDLVWDEDVNPEGFAATFRFNMSGSDDLFSMDRRDRTMFLTVGAFSVDEIEYSGDDKWLFATQIGYDMIFEDQSSFKIALAYYDYYNIEGKRSPVSQPNLYDTTAPGFVQKGNSMFDISNVPGEPFQRFGLASDYNLVDLTLKYDIARFAPFHVILSGDYVENIGYDADDITSRLEGGLMFVNSTFATDDPENAETTGYMLKVTLGWPNVLLRDTWQTFFAFKHLERDAVPDAFTDSDFHLGGTNAEGWIIGGSYSLIDNTYLKVRYLSADEIVGPPLGIDVIQVDLNTKF